jgi:carbon-monoxide dehydrogenase catalytic subunit
LKTKGLGKWGFSAGSLRDGPHDDCPHRQAKRKALGIDKARERVLMDMTDRRDIDAA